MKHTAYPQAEPALWRDPPAFRVVDKLSTGRLVEWSAWDDVFAHRRPRSWGWNVGKPHSYTQSYAHIHSFAQEMWMSL